jgi:hypothetical protein
MDTVKTLDKVQFPFSKSTKILLILLFFVIFVADSERNNKIMLSHIDFALLGFFKFYVCNKK